MIVTGKPFLTVSHKLFAGEMCERDKQFGSAKTRTILGELTDSMMEHMI